MLHFQCRYAVSITAECKIVWFFYSKRTWWRSHYSLLYRGSSDRQQHGPFMILIMSAQGREFNPRSRCYPIFFMISDPGFIRFSRCILLLFFAFHCKHQIYIFHLFQFLHLHCVYFQTYLVVYFLNYTNHCMNLFLILLSIIFFFLSFQIVHFLHF